MTKSRLNLRNVAIVIACLVVTSLTFSCSPAPQKLFDAIEQNDSRKVKELIAKGADVNAENDKGMRALPMAAKKGNIEIVEALIAAGADVNYQFLRLTSGKGPAIYTVILYAVGEGHTEVVKALLAAGANANAGHLEDGKSVLTMAAMNGNADIVAAMLKAGADANTKDGSSFSALMAAADRGHLEIAKLLLAAGADVNAATKNIYDVTQSGLTALMFAAFNGHSEVAELLITAGADVSLKSGVNNNAREIAAHKGHGDIVKLIDAAAQK